MVERRIVVRTVPKGVGSIEDKEIMWFRDSSLRMIEEEHQETSAEDKPNGERMTRTAKVLCRGGDASMLSTVFSCHCHCRAFFVRFQTLCTSPNDLLHTF